MDELLGRLKNLDDIKQIQVTEPTAKTDPYMNGLANGLILAFATMTDTEPEFINRDKS